MTAPTLEASGTVAAVTTGNLTVTLPTHQANDILIVVLSGWVPNTTTGTNVTAAPGGGWAKLLSDPLINTQIDGEWAIFWRRATASGTANPVFTRPASWDTGTDTCWAGRAYVIRGCITTGNPWDAAVKSALHSTANQAFPAVTVSGAERTVIQFLSKADDNGGVTAASGWTIDTAATTATGTDASFQTIRKVNVSTSTTADTATITAPVTGLRYQFYGISFVPQPDADISSVGSASTTVSDTAQLTVSWPPTTVDSVGSVSTTVSDTAQLTVSTPGGSGPVYVSDDFNRADGVLGSNWTVTGDGTIAVSSNTARMTSGSGDAYAMWNGTVAGNQWAELDLNGLVFDGADGSVMVRMQANGIDGYAFTWTYITGSTGEYKLHKVVSGAWSLIGSAVQNVGITGPRRLRLEVIGNTLVGYVNGTEHIRYTDVSSPYTTGKVGIQIYRTGTGIESPTIDNFSAGDIIWGHIGTRGAEGSSGGTTAAMNTTGAKLLVAMITCNGNGNSSALTDSAGNTWVSTPQVLASSANHFLRVLYCLNPTTSASHTFTAATGAESYSTLSVSAFSAPGNAAYVTGAAAPNTTQPSLTTTGPNQLVFSAGYHLFADSYSTDILLELSDSADTSTVDVGGSTAYTVKQTAGVITPTWYDVGGMLEWATTIHAFSYSTAVEISSPGSVSTTVSDTAGIVVPGTPNAITNLAGSPGSSGAVVLTWTAPTGTQ